MKKNNYIICIISFICILLVYSSYQSIEQIKERKQDYYEYTNILESISKNEDITSIIERIENLEEKYGQGEQLILAKIEAYINYNDFENISKEFENLFEHNKANRNNPGFLCLYAEALYKNGNKEKAQDIIKIADEIGIPEEYIEIVNEINM